MQDTALPGSGGGVAAGAHEALMVFLQDVELGVAVLRLLFVPRVHVHTRVQRAHHPAREVSFSIQL